MAIELSSTDLYFFLKEQEFLKESKIEKIYQLEKDKIILKIFKEGQKKNLIIQTPNLICFSDKEYKAPINPPGFCMSLRKHITKGKITNVKQQGFERIIILDIICKGIEYQLILELFKPGNIILLQNDKIINCVERQVFKDREIKHHQPYKFPPIQTNLLQLEEQEFYEIFKKSDKDLVKCLAIDFSLGGLFAEEIIFRQKLDKNTKEKNADISKKIYEGTKNFFSEKINAWHDKIKPYPLEMLSLTKTQEKINCETFNEAIEYFLDMKKEIKSKNKENKKEKKSVIDIQSKRIKDLENEIKENQKIGEFIYENYQDFSTLLDKIKEMKKTKSLDQIETELKKNKHFKNMDKKEKTITLEF